MIHKNYTIMKKIFSLLMALTLVVGANAGENLRTKEVQLSKKNPAVVLPSEVAAVQTAMAQQAGETINVVCDSLHIYDLSDVVATEKPMMNIVSANDDYSVSIILALTQYYGTYDANIQLTPKSGATAVSADGKVTLAEEDDRILVTSIITGNDGNTYNIRMKQAPVVIPECKDTVVIDIPKATFTNKLSTSDAFMLQGKTTDLMYAVSIQPNNVGGKVAGSYDAGELDSYWSYVLYDPFVNGNNDDAYITFLAGKVDVTLTADNMVNVTAALVGADATFYKITMKAQYDAVVRLEYDAQTGSVDRTYTAGTDKVTVDASYASRGILVVEAENAASTDYVVLEFFSPAVDKDIVIPAGTYPINYSAQAGTLLASTGNTTTGIYPSYYSNLSDEGKLMTPIYFMVSGNAVVENADGALKITVDAVNSYDRPIHVVINAGVQTALDNTTADKVAAQKVVKDGQVYILRNGKTYTVTGAEVE